MKKKIAILTTGWSYEFIFDVLGGIKDAVKDDEVDLYMFLCYGYYDETSAFNHGEYNVFNLIHYEDFDGVILFSNIFNSLEVLEQEKDRILESKTPVVSLEYKLEDVDYIGTDNYSGMHDITEHLVKDHGLRDIAYITGPDDNYESIERERAFVDVMFEYNIKPKAGRIVPHGNWSYEFAYDATANLVKDRSNMPEAIVCVNDEGAIAAITCLYKLGINVPREVKVVGFDDMKSAAIITPAISTVNRNWKGLGYRAIAHLNKLMNGESVEHEEVINSVAVKRASCGCKVDLGEDYTNDRLDLFYQQKMGLNFNKNQRHLEEVFMEIEEPEYLLETVRNFFLENPFFSGISFSILLEEESIPQEVNFEDLWIRMDGYSDHLLNAIHIENGELMPVCKMETRQLLPESLLSENNDVFLFVPFHFQGQVLGYFVGKNALGLIENRHCYDSSKGVSSGYARFCQKRINMLTNKKLTDLYMRDAMTGLFNRLGYKKLGNTYFENNKNKSQNTIIIFADINYMKGINDTYGHLHGDLAIKTVAEVLRESYPEDWLGIRYGGDEYLLIGTNADEEQILQYCKNVTARLQERVQKMALPYPLSISTGYHIVDVNKDISLDDAVKLADEMMYHHKQEFHERESQIS